MRIFGDKQSGNCYKIQLLLAHLGTSCDWVDIDILNGDTKTQQFLAMNPNGKIPLLELDNGDYLTESNAILNYLADGTDYLPGDSLQRAKVLSWQFFEQYSHEPFIAVARFINHYLGLPKERQQEYESKHEGGYKALAVMETQLQKSDYLAGNSLTIADISLYAYTHVAHEGGFDLSGYPAIVQWLGRIEAHPAHTEMG